MPNLHGESVNNYGTKMYILQRLETSSISYRGKQLAELNSWNREALFLSLFGTTDFINIDTKNISTLFF